MRSIVCKGSQIFKSGRYSPIRFHPVSCSQTNQTLLTSIAHQFTITLCFCSYHVNMVLLRDLLLQPALPDRTAKFYRLEGAAKPSLSKKGWAADYPEVTRFRLYINPDLNAINALFGDEDALDHHLLNRDVMSSNETVEWFQSEGDSVRAFYTKVSLPIQLAFQTDHGAPFIVQRSESGPLGSTQVSQTIDFTWGWADRFVLMMGELKKHGMIDVATWRGVDPTDHNRKWLGKELRGYCHKYKCFAASVFDGQYLLILMFHAENFQRIREQNCPTSCVIFSRDCPTLRYGLFRTVTHQIRRMQAMPSVAPAVTLDGYIRRYRLPSGHPYWVNGNNEHQVHPNGYIRMFQQYGGVWFWAYPDGSPVLDQNGGFVWDTVALGL
ncbi:hypothetical protein VTI74DRAFT_7490 [Chaetomium olivicolor]